MKVEDDGRIEKIMENILIDQIVEYILLKYGNLGKCTIDKIVEYVQSMDIIIRHLWKIPKTSMYFHVILPLLANIHS